MPEIQDYPPYLEWIYRRPGRRWKGRLRPETGAARHLLTHGSRTPTTVAEPAAALHCQTGGWGFTAARRPASAARAALKGRTGALAPRLRP